MRIYVIIPVYNVEKYLNKCLDSVFNQTCYKTHEIIPICINDGSTDGSLNILNKYKTDHPELVIINKKNGGLSSARNAGLDYIKNDINSCFIFLDSDDYLDTNYIEKLLAPLNEYGGDIVCSIHINVDENEQEPEFEYSSEIEILDKFESLKALFGNRIYSHGPCKIYKTKTWNNIRYDENVSFMEDQRTEFKVFLNANKIINYDYSGYYYVHRIGSLCQSKMTNKKIIDAMNSYIITYEYDYKDFTDEQIKEIRKLILQQFANIYLMMLARFNKKSATQNELDLWKNIKKFNRKYKCIKNFKATTKKEKIKKYVYLLIPFFYRFLFSFFLKEYDK